MAFFTAASKADFQHQLQTALAQHLGDKALPQVTLFAEQFFSLISLDELTQRRLSDLVGAPFPPGACWSASTATSPKSAYTTPTTRSTAGNPPTPR